MGVGDERVWCIFNEGRRMRVCLTEGGVDDGLCVFVNSEKKLNVLSLSTVFIFSKLTISKYLYEHNKIQQLRHKLNQFHRHVANRNRIMCP